MYGCMNFSARSLLFLVMCFYAVNSQAVTIDVGQIDDREYDFIVLENQLKVLLISDPKADKAAASLDVHVGSSDDPIERQGLAHFLEHMLFLGTKKYPNAADYQAFIDGNGGSHNAYTSAEHTNYFFDIDANKLEPALDRFSQFFVAPLFTPAYVDRERHAVHSEYQAKIKDDYRRGFDVYRQLLNPKHPYAKFSVGSLTTLSDRPDDNVRDDLLDFYQEHYTSDDMALVVLGKEPISTLKQWVVSRFTDIPLIDRENLHNHSERIPLFTDQKLPFEAVSRPVTDLRRMSMSFPLTSVEQYYDEKPLSYIGSIVGHEGEGSLLSLLKEQGWAEALSAGGGDAGANNSVFSVTVGLTEEGINNRVTIRALIFYVLEQIRKKGIDQWRYEEEKQLANLAFQFREKGRAVDTVRTLADHLHDYPVEEVISAAYLYKKYDPELIESLLAQMTVDNYYVTTVFPEAQTDKKTPYYNVPYSVNQLSADIEKLPRQLTKRFKLPAKNIYVPEETQLYPDNDSLAEPQLLDTRNNNVELWAKQDTRFGVPKAHVSLRVQSPLASSSLRDAALNELLVDMINDNLTEQSYPALLAGLNYSLDVNSRGIDIRVNGYNHKLALLLEHVADVVRKPKLDKTRFANVKIESLRHLRNSAKKTPYHQMIASVPTTLYSPYWSDKDLAQEMESITLKELKAFSKHWLKGAYVKGLFYGNINEVLVDKWAYSVKKLSKRGGQEVVPAKMTNLPISDLMNTDSADNSVVQNVAPEEKHIVVDHDDVAVGLYVQGPSDNIEDQAKMVLLRQILESPFYSQLRTEQQLGYIVFLTSMKVKAVPGSLFVVQSPRASVEEIKQAITTFIDSTTIPDDLSVFQESVASNWLEKPTTLSDQSSRYWRNILRDDKSFSYRERIVKAINQTSGEELREYFRETMANSLMSMWFVASKDSQEQSPVFPENQRYYIYP